MSQTLYRKYRSQKFGQLVGQQQVIRILRNAIQRDRMSHAYLFSGPRGTGKTSVARIFAKAINCLTPVDGDCCDVCEHCLEISQGRAVDVIEIDAASKNKVDDIRELRERVVYAPVQYHHKIYIIDEAHMITTQGYNALLKTLEEPPSFIKFFLCTTEPNKLPITILSRCMRLDFTRLDHSELAEHLCWMATEEQFQLAADAALLLCKLAEGSARDAISLLDQLTVFCDQTITLEDVQRLFQLGDANLAHRVVSQLEVGESQGALEAWDHITEQGMDAGRFLAGVAEELKARYLEHGQTKWRSALGVIWQAMNLIKVESNPALLVELSLINAEAALTQTRVDQPRSGKDSTTPASPTDQGAPTTDPKSEANAPRSSSTAARAKQLAASAKKRPLPTSKQQPVTTTPQVESARPKQDNPPVAADPLEPDKSAPVTDRSAPMPGDCHENSNSQAACQESGSAAENWDRFLKLLQGNVTAYAPLHNAEGQFVDNQLQISFQRSNRINFKFAQGLDNMRAYVRCAQEVLGPEVEIVIGFKDEPATHINLKERLQREKAGSGAVPVELVAELVDETDEQEEDLPVVDPEKLQQEAESMVFDPAQPPPTKAAGNDISQKSPPTAQDAMLLFEAEEIPREEAE